ncbi:MAG: metal-dependent hydrolase [Verrucomicrobia bacterium]|nr:metal-dependent hydrolase [Verrucomicrobiota bacterium]
MRLTSYGHSCFLVELPGARLVFDPYLLRNPAGSTPLTDLPCDYILCTHAHDDHIADALALAQLHRATLVAPFELAEHFANDPSRPNTIDLMPGGGIDLPWGRIQMTPAIHSSSLELPGGKNLSMGVASGYLVTAAGQSLYHAGDTALFSDMALIGRGSLDLALLPIGDRYTMGPADALSALDLLRPRLAVPMHYNTTPVIRQDPHAFATAAARLGHAVKVLGLRESLDC